MSFLHQSKFINKIVVAITGMAVSLSATVLPVLAGNVTNTQNSTQVQHAISELYGFGAFAVNIILALAFLFDVTGIIINTHRIGLYANNPVGRQEAIQKLGQCYLMLYPIGFFPLFWGLITIFTNV